MSKETVKTLMEIVKRIEYWEEILGFTLDENAMNADNLDEYIKHTYAKTLKDPAVMARILGSKHSNNLY